MANASSAYPLRWSNTEGLDYKPKWYLVGDPDNSLTAVLYGLVVLATVMRVEDLVELYLFHRFRGVSWSDLGALVTFRSSTWVELTNWIFRRRRGSHPSYKTVLGIVLRFIITLAEVFILVASIPRSVPVYEHDVPVHEGQMLYTKHVHLEVLEDHVILTKHQWMVFRNLHFAKFV